MRRFGIALAALLAAAAAGGCMSVEQPPEAKPFQAERIGRIHRASAALDALVPNTATIEKLADGFRWSEGPVWIREGGYLLLSDVPANKMFRW